MTEAQPDSLLQPTKRSEENAILAIIEGLHKSAQLFMGVQDFQHLRPTNNLHRKGHIFDRDYSESRVCVACTFSLMKLRSMATMHANTAYLTKAW